MRLNLPSEAEIRSQERDTLRREKTRKLSTLTRKKKYFS